MQEPLDHTDTTPAPPDVTLPVDRSRAAVRAVWRLLVAAPLVGTLCLMSPDWRLLWIDDRATFLAYAVIWLALAVAAICAGLSTIRWALLVCWSGATGADLSPEAITFRLGPFGTRRYAWKDIRIQYPDGIGADVADQLPGDVVWPRMHHGPTGADVAVELMRFVALDGDALLQALRPHLSRASDRHDPAG